MLKRRIEDAGRSIDIDQLALCPQCGFSSNVGTGTFPLDVVERKLARIVEVADQIWAESRTSRVAEVQRIADLLEMAWPLHSWGIWVAGRLDFG